MSTSRLNETRRNVMPYLELPKSLWNAESVNCPFDFASVRRLPDIRDRSATVRFPPGPVPEARSSLMKRSQGSPW